MFTTNRSQLDSHGFTLIELLVVIAIIGILASVVLASLTTARARSKIATAQQQIQQIAKAVESARIMSGRQQLRTITGSSCTYCGSALTQEARLQNALQNISNAAGTFDGLSAATRDPWGNVYLLDENEGEQAGNPCLRDVIRTSNNVVTYRFEYGTDQCRLNPQGVAGFQ